MFGFLKSESKEKEKENLKPKSVLVIDSARGPITNWYETFKGATLRNGTPIHVEQAGWDEISLAAYTHSNSDLVVDLNKSRNPLEGTPQNRIRSIQPDFVLIRNEFRGVKTEQDKRNILFGLKFGQVQSINSLDSIFQMMERPWVYAELVKINKRLGDEKFPLITQYYYPNADEMIITPDYPIVVKLGHAHAGYGKMKLDNHRQFADFRSVVQCTDHYCTSEPFIEGEYDIRIQVVGDSIRAFKRIGVGGSWKTNTGAAIMERIPITDAYRLWVKECRSLFGGLEIFAIDAIHCAKENKEYILEINGTSIGLADDGEAEEEMRMRDMVLARMNEIFC